MWVNTFWFLVVILWYSAVVLTQAIRLDNKQHVS